MVTVFPLSPVPVVVAVTILPASKVATPPEVSVPPIVKSVLGRSLAEIEALSAALVSAVIKTATTSDPAIFYSFISPRRISDLRFALPTGGKSCLEAFFVVAFFAAALGLVLEEVAILYSLTILCGEEVININ
jgi:hypothetical protein